MTLTVGTLLKEKLAGGGVLYHRVTRIDAAADEVFLFEASEKMDSTGKPVRFGLRWLESRMTEGRRKRFCVVKDHIRLATMKLQDHQLSDEVRASRDVRWELIKPFWGPWCNEKGNTQPSREPELYERGAFAKVVREIAFKGKLSESAVRKLFAHVWNFGCDRNACISLHERCGASGKQRIGAAVKSGRKSSLELREDFVGRPSQFDDIRIFEVALTEFWAKRGLSLNETHRRMREDLYVISNGIRDTKGNLLKFPVDGRLVPTIHQFKHRAPEIIERLDLLAIRVGQKAMRERNGDRVGHSSDLADNGLDVFDLDGTLHQMHLLGGWDGWTHVNNPTVMLAVDRESHAIVGFYDGLTHENWDAYRLCLFSAFTPKDKLLAELGLPPEAWPLHGRCAAAYFDRGPAISEAAKEALCDELKIERALARPNTPTDKGLVESIIKRTQELMAEHQGSVSTSKNIRTQEKRRKLKKQALHTPREFRYFLVMAIIEHNTQTTLPQRLLTAEMRADGCVHTPQSAFIWYQNERRGDHAMTISDEEIYIKLLPRKEKAVRSNGIQIESVSYSSQALREFRYKHQSRSGLKAKNAMITILLDPIRPGVIYWAREDGSIEPLYPSRGSAHLLQNQTWLDAHNARLDYLAEKQERENQRPLARHAGRLKAKQRNLLYRYTGMKRPAAKLPRPGEVSMARAFEQQVAAAAMRERTSGFLPDRPIHSSAPTSPHPSADRHIEPERNLERAQSSSDELDSLLSKLLGEP
ncbi:hypothetical protein [Burkholderia vietnamiensis]|uniref:hypothetical protein n=1 Tax=Burkholderia vietnamiensis TaxID=60552 RepID=UPI001CF0D60F|nr:hypothetical protein [Burkholderia vietnamiensis]MCA8287321.1 hypothetical protein [Burkholderia vietnamiensis]